MIKIIESRSGLTEAELESFEKDEGWTLIAVNCAVTNEYMTGMGPESYKHDVTRWTYHFRTNEEKSDAV